MSVRSWMHELGDEAHAAWAELRAFWSQHVWPLFMAAGIFLVMAMPIILVILLLWYLDTIGWRSSGGFYTIGEATHWMALVSPA